VLIFVKKYSKNLFMPTVWLDLGRWKYNFLP